MSKLIEGIRKAQQEVADRINEIDCTSGYIDPLDFPTRIANLDRIGLKKAELEYAKNEVLRLEEEIKELEEERNKNGG